MALTPLQWSCVNHLVAYELSPPDNRLGHAEFCAMIGITMEILDRFRTTRYTCACGKVSERLSPPTKVCECGSNEWTLTPLHPDFLNALKDALRQATETTDFFALRSRQWALEEMVRLYKDKKTTDTNKRHILKSIREETVDAVPIKHITDFSLMPDEELERLMLDEETDASKAFTATMKEEVG